MFVKNQEQKLRRALRKVGYSLFKSRAKTWSYDDQGGYMVVDTSGNYVVAGARFDLTLDDVQNLLSGMND